MSNVFLDCGSHFGEGLLEFTRHYKMDSSWIIYAFEPNQESFKKLISNPEIKLPVTFINKALWLYDDRVTLNAEVSPESKAPDGTGSSIIPLAHWHPNVPENPSAGDTYVSYDVECLDLSAFILKNFKSDDFIVMKMDVEGAEFDILRKMIKDGSMRYIKQLLIEFHSWAYYGESIETRDTLVQQIQALGVQIGNHL